MTTNPTPTPRPLAELTDAERTVLAIAWACDPGNGFSYGILTLKEKRATARLVKLGFIETLEACGIKVVKATAKGRDTLLTAMLPTGAAGEGGEGGRES